MTNDQIRKQCNRKLELLESIFSDIYDNYKEVYNFLSANELPVGGLNIREYCKGAEGYYGSSRGDIFFLATRHGVGVELRKYKLMYFFGVKHFDDEEGGQTYDPFDLDKVAKILISHYPESFETEEEALMDYCDSLDRFIDNMVDFESTMNKAIRNSDR